MKKTIYTLFLCFLCIFCSFFMFGCDSKSVDMAEVYQTNAFRILRQANSDESINLAYIFPVNTQDFKEKGLSDGQIRSLRFYLTLYVNALAEQNRIRAEEGVEVGSATYFEDVDGIGFTIKFDNLDAQKKFFGVEDESDDQKESSQKISGFFIKRLQLDTTFPISNIETANNLKQVCQLALSSWAALNEDIQLEELMKIYDQSNFIYHFSSSQSGLKSNLCFQQGGFVHNVFIKSMQDISEEKTQISFYATYPNTSVWYASALLTVILAVMVAILITKYRSTEKTATKNKNKGS